MPSSGKFLPLAAALFVLGSAVMHGQQSNAAALLAEVRARETVLRRDIDTRASGSDGLALARRSRILTGSYEHIARLFPVAGRADAALWQGATLSADTFWEFGEAVDKAHALRLLRDLSTRYATSPLAKGAPPIIARLVAAEPVSTPAPRMAAAPTRTPAPAKASPKTPPASSTAAPAGVPWSAGASAPAAATSSLSRLTSIRRELLPDALRITLELEREATFFDERIDGPPRVFIDLQNARAADTLKDAVLVYGDDVVRQIRVGRQLGSRVRVVLDLAGAERHSTYALYNPYRVVIDIERSASQHLPLRAATPPPPVVPAVLQPRTRTANTPAAAPAAVVPAARVPTSPAPAATGTVARPSVAPAPRLPAPRAGAMSLSRQLGLGVSRIVIDAGHGGQDPGAQAQGLNESDIVLDVATRLEKLLIQQGVEVLMTRRSDVFVPLEARAALANRQDADLFLSIHANASEDARARGVETYFLNFAQTPRAEAVAARENAASARTMSSLPDLVKAIALANKTTESRDLAGIIQAALMERLRKSNSTARNLGVKQAPFMVLVGATMPSVLAEISFLTNRQEAGMLKTPAYRQQVAQALLDGVLSYQRSLKGEQRAAQ